MSFLQFCPTCEQQILVPSNTMLYCSEQCRRADCGMASPQSPIRSLKSTPPPPHTIVPPLSPTQLKRPTSFVRPATSPQTQPSSSVDRANTRPTPHERTTSEAANYLSQFQSEKARSMRPRSSRHTATLAGATNIPMVPSLSSTPTSTPSSSVSFTPSSSREHIPTSAGYHPTSASNARSMASRSIDLVLPTAMDPIVPKSAQSRPLSIDTITPKTAAISLSRSGRVRTGVKEMLGSLDEDEYGSGSGTPKMQYEKRQYQRESGSGPSAKSSLKTLLTSPGGSKVKSSERERERDKFAAAA